MVLTIIIAAISWVITAISWVITIVYGIRQRTFNRSLFEESSTILTRLENLLKEANEAKKPCDLIGRIDEIRSFMASLNHTICLTQKPFWGKKTKKSQG